MALQFNAGEVFEIARQIERNGARFYRRAAEGIDETETAGLLRNLAEMEDAHRRVFETLASRLEPKEAEKPLYDPYGEADQYLRALAGGHVFDLRADPTEWLDGQRTRPEVLRKAIEIEKDSILFYLGMKDSVPERLGKERIDEIIKQEMNHVTLLTSRLRYAEQ